MRINAGGKLINISNNYNLPPELYAALAKETYDSGKSDYSITTLLAPPQQVQLKKRYSKLLTEDAMDRCWSLFGQAIHSVLERASHTEALSEQRFYMDIEGRRISGQVDHYHDKTISDFKVTSAWTLVYGSRLEEWEHQLNAYALLLRRNGYTVDRLRINCILRDHDKNRAKQDSSYPQTPIVVVPITLWDEEKQYTFLQYLVKKHIDNEHRKDHELYPCSSEDMWEQAPKFAVMKEGRKTALRVFETAEEAQRFIDGAAYSDNYKVDIVARPGRRTRCSDYCLVKDYCPQWKEYIGDRKE